MAVAVEEIEEEEDNVEGKASVLLEMKILGRSVWVLWEKDREYGEEGMSIKVGSSGGWFEGE